MILELLGSRIWYLILYLDDFGSKKYIFGHLVDFQGKPNILYASRPDVKASQIYYIWIQTGFRSRKILYMDPDRFQVPRNIIYGSRPVSSPEKYYIYWSGPVSGPEKYYIWIQTGCQVPNNIIYASRPVSGEAKYIIDWVWCLRGSQIYYGLGMMSQGRPNILLTNIII